MVKLHHPVTPEPRTLTELLQDLGVTRPTWWAYALCRDPKWKEQGITWFPIRGQSTKRALEVCGKCPARPGCLRMAIDDPTLTGIFGGMDDQARNALRQLAQRQGLITPKENT
jgi:hypothetical protein